MTYEEREIRKAFWVTVVITGIVFSLTFMLLGCTEIQNELDKLEAPPIEEVVSTPEPTATPSTDTIVVNFQYMTKSESQLLIDNLRVQLPKLDRAADDMAARFCPKYKSLSDYQRSVVWGYLANAIIYREAGVKNGFFKKCSSMQESNGDLSQGWFQLTYGNKYCPKKKSEGDLCDIAVNVSCGTKLMGHFVEQAGLVTAGGYQKYGAPPDKGLARYWSVIRVPDSKRQHHLQEIIEKTQKAPGCK